MHSKTLRPLALLLCGEGVFYRTGPALRQFFRDAELPDPGPVEDTRFTWTLARLRAYNQDPAQITAVLLQLARPAEYPDRAARRRHRHSERGRVGRPGFTGQDDLLAAQYGQRAVANVCHRRVRFWGRPRTGPALRAAHLPQAAGKQLRPGVRAALPTALLYLRTQFMFPNIVGN